MLKERMGAALNSGNLKADEHHHDHELVAAFGVGASWLGNRLWRMKYADDLQHAETRKVIHRLASMMSMRQRSSPLAEVFAEEALREWLEDRCLTCSGKGFTGSDYGQVKTVERKCVPCQGSGYLRVQDGVFSGEFKPGEVRYRRVGCGDCLRKGYVREQVQTGKAKTQICGACNGTGALRRSANARLRAVNARIEARNKVATRNAHFKPIPPMGTETTERANEWRQWVGRMDRLIGAMRTADSYQADRIRKKLG